MEWLIAHAATFQVLLGAAGAAWALFAKIDSSYKRHLHEALKNDVASKADLASLSHHISRVETKLDDILLDGFRQSTGRRHAKRPKKRARTVA